MACNEKTFATAALNEIVVLDNGDNTFTPTTLADVQLDESVLVGEDSSALVRDELLSDPVLTEDTAYDCNENYSIPTGCNSYDGTDIEWDSCWAIDGYYDGMLSACGDCAESEATAWDGAFDLTEYGCVDPYTSVNWRPEEGQ